MSKSPPRSATSVSVRQPAPSATEVVRALSVGCLVGVVVALLAPWQAVPLLSWAAAALSWVGVVWIRIGHLDSRATSAHATREDPRRAAADILLLSASVVSIVAVVLGVIKATTIHGDLKLLVLGSGILTIVASWGVVHTVFTLRYAALFYTGQGGANFNERAEPCYLDFAYLALTIGMTYQVSDTDLTTKTMRHTALRHALLSYLFGTIIVATTINVAAGLAK